MHNKWMILVAGVGTVFATLAGLILLVIALKLIFNGKPANKKAAEEPQAPTAPSPKTATPSGGSPKPDNTALVAVIAAAISASTGLAPSQFRIASMKAEAVSESGFNTPVWGRIERFSRK
jgi:sodium pump decarboxylase gamma subunit